MENILRYRDGPEWEDPFCLVGIEGRGQGRVTRMEEEIRKVDEVLGFGVDD